jgi:LCP family protein required for cell wall assembly
MVIAGGDVASGSDRADPERAADPEDTAAQPVTPPARRRRRRVWWAWLCVVFGTVLVLLSGTALAGVNILVHRYASHVTRDDLLGPAGKPTLGRSALDGPLTILLVGSDYRKGAAEKLWRADTIIVLHVPATHDHAYLISFSRDTWVHIPRSEDGEWQGGEDKLNAAFVRGGNGASGYRLLAKTLSQLMKVQFDSGAVIDFYGFRRVVDVVGGVDMCVETPPGTDKFVSIHPPYRTFHKGCQHLNGYQAIDYVRQRKQFPDGDWARMRHQQQFLKALLKAAREQGVHRDLGKLDRLIRAGGESLTIDDSLPVEDLAFTLRRIKPDDLTAIQVPAEDRQGLGWYTEIVEPAPSLFRAVRDDTLDQWVIDHPTYVNPLT